MKYEKVLELHLECRSGNNSELAELGIDSDDTEWRPCLVPFDAIMYVFPHAKEGTSIVIGGEQYRFKESYGEIKAMINEV